MRVFLFLLLATAAAAQPIQCVPEDYRAVNVAIERKPSFELVRITRPKIKGMQRTRIGDVTIYTRRDKAKWGIHVLNVIAERGGSWFQLHFNGGPPVLSDRTLPRPETERPPVVLRVKRRPSLVRVTWIEEWMGANRAGLTRHTVLLDFRAKPRVLLSIDCSDAGGGGYCTGPDAAHDPTETMTCDDDLRCTTRQFLSLDWATRSATRTFDLLTNETIPPSRFDSVTYASGAAFAAAAPESIRQRVLIAGIGTIDPIHEVSPGTVLFAARVREPIVGFRFFLLRNGTWREIPLTLLTDERYPGENLQYEQAGSLSPDFSPDGPLAEFSAYDLELPGKRKLIEIVATEDKARSIYWIMLDPGGRTGALRVATNQPEWRHCGDVVYPITASYLGIPESGLPAQVQAVASWRWWDLRDQKLPRTCDLVGTIDWSSKRGWIVRLGQAPCTDPGMRPLGVSISEQGDLRADPVSFSQ